MNQFQSKIKFFKDCLINRNKELAKSTVLTKTNCSSNKWALFYVLSLIGLVIFNYNFWIQFNRNVVLICLSGWFLIVSITYLYSYLFSFSERSFVHSYFHQLTSDNSLKDLNNRIECQLSDYTFKKLIFSNEIFEPNNNIRDSNFLYQLRSVSVEEIKKFNESLNEDESKIFTAEIENFYDAKKNVFNIEAIDQLLDKVKNIVDDENKKLLANKTMNTIKGINNNIDLLKNSNDNVINFMLANCNTSKNLN